MIFWIWLLSIAHGFLFILTTPQWEGFDEPFHYGYIQYLAEHRQIPIYGQTLVSREIIESFRVVPLSAAVNSNLGNRYTAFTDYWKLPAAARIERENALRGIPHIERQIPDESKDRCMNYEAQHPPLYYLLGAGIYRLFARHDLPTLVFVLRSFSLLLGSLTVFVAWGAAKHLYSASGRILCVPLLIALLPMFFSTVARISNDSLGVTLFSLLVLLVLRYLGSGGTRRQAVLIGIVTGLGLMTKAYFLTALPAIALILLTAGFKRKTLGRVIEHLLVAFILVLVIAGWWYARNYFLYGNMSGLFVIARMTPIAFQEQVKLAAQVPWLTGINVIFREQVWIGNSSFVSLSRMVYLCAMALVAVAILGFVKSCVLRPRSGSEFHVGGTGRTLQAMAIFYAFFVLGLMYQMLQAFISSRQFVTGGWYLYAAIIPEVLLLCGGFEALLARGTKGPAPFLLVASAAVLNFLGNFCKAIPYYAGFIIPRFHLADFFDLYSPANFRLMVERLAINKPSFVTPVAIGVQIIGYFALLLFVLGLWFRTHRSSLGRRTLLYGSSE